MKNQNDQHGQNEETLTEGQYFARQEQIKKEEFEKRLHNRGIGLRFMDKTFDNFAKDSQNMPAFGLCRGFVSGFSTYKATGTGIMLYGAWGIGKTHLATAMCRKLAEQDKWFQFINCPSFLEDIRCSFGKKSRPEIYDKSRETDLLVIDDIGKEKPSEWVAEQLYILINYRYTEKKPTIFTTNKGEKELSDNIGAATVDRIYEMTERQEITGKSKRR